MLEKISGHSVRAEKSSKSFFIFGCILAASGGILAFWNLWVFYTGILPALSDSKSEASFFSTIFHVPVSIPLILLLEVFAFVMFRYYSKALERMRAYTDEVNTLQMVKTGLLSIVEYGTEKEIAGAGHKLMTMERSRIIEGKGTVETLNTQDETQNVANMLDILQKLQTSLSKDGK